VSVIAKHSPLAIITSQDETQCLFSNHFRRWVHCFCTMVKMRDNAACVVPMMDTCSEFIIAFSSWFALFRFEVWFGHPGNTPYNLCIPPFSNSAWPIARVQTIFPLGCQFHSPLQEAFLNSLSNYPFNYSLAFSWLKEINVVARSGCHPTSWISFVILLHETFPLLDKPPRSRARAITGFN
jgi:hypothetical protein